MGITTIFLLLGGLGLFLFGMKLMSDGLEQVAGARMRSILEFFTKNRFVGMLASVKWTFTPFGIEKVRLKSPEF